MSAPIGRATADAAQGSTGAPFGPHGKTDQIRQGAQVSQRAQFGRAGIRERHDRRGAVYSPMRRGCLPEIVPRLACGRLARSRTDACFVSDLPGLVGVPASKGPLGMIDCGLSTIGM